MIEVFLTEEEFELCLKESKFRNTLGRSNNMVHKWGFKESNDTAKQNDLIGCMGEAALMKHLNLPIVFSKMKEKDISGLYQVRSGEYSPYFLKLHDDDLNGDKFIACHVNVKHRKVKILGWIMGYNGKLRKYWGDKWNNGRPCFNVPEDDLEPIETLQSPSLAKFM